MKHTIKRLDTSTQLELFYAEGNEIQVRIRLPPIDLRRASSCFIAISPLTIGKGYDHSAVSRQERIALQ